MRYVERDRIEPPKLFGSEPLRQARETLQQFLSGATQKTLQSRYSGTPDLLESLGIQEPLFQLFSGRCAMCETQIGSDWFETYRFRPPANAEPVSDISQSHLYYIWLENAWQNLYPLCPECRPDQPQYFPVASNRRCPLPSPEELELYVRRGDGRWPTFPVDEQPVLADPCYDRKLWRHFQFGPDGSVIGRDRRGRETIAHFKLDRPPLVSRRAAFFQLQIANYRQVLSAVRENPNTFDLFNFDEIEFGGGWYILLRELLSIALERRAGGDVPEQALALARQSDGLENFNRAVTELQSRAERGVKGGEGTLSLTPAAREAAVAPMAVRIRNFKSLEALDFVMPPAPAKGPGGAGVLAPSLLILGENAAGKSTILEAIAITLMDPAQRRLLDLPAGRLVLNPGYMGAEEQIHPDQASVEIAYENGQEQRLTITPGSGESSRNFVAEDYADEGARSTLPLFAYGAHRQYLSAERRYSPHKHIRSLFQSDEVLSNPEKWLMRLSAAQFNMVVRGLREVFSVDGTFEVLERDGDGVFVVAALDSGPGSQLQRAPLGVVSSGFRAVLAMLCDIMQGLMDKRINPAFETLETTRGLVLIDEVEAHLHPRWKMAIMTGLRRALPGVIFIATSHDPLCLRGMDKGEVMVLQRIPGTDAETRLPVFTQSLVDLPDNQNWTIEQLLTADFFNLRSTANSDRERHIAEMEDRLARGVKPEDDPQLRAFLGEISRELPIGDSETRRLVQEAVAEYLAERRGSSDAKLRRLRRETKDQIIAALRAAG